MISVDKLLEGINRLLLDPAFMKGAYELVRNKSKEEDKLIKDFVNLARRDLEAAKLLHMKRSYSLAIYHLQQSVEKAAKAWALDSFFIDKIELHHIGHLSPLAFSAILDRYVGIRFVSVTGTVFPRTEKGTLVLEEIVRTNSTTFAKLPRDQIQKVLGICRQLLNEVPEAMSRMVAAVADSLSNTKGLLNEQQSEALRIWTEKYLQKAGTERSYRLVRSALSGVQLFLLSVLTFPHAFYTRYPDLALKPSEYNESLGIVEVFDEVCSVIDKAINDFSSSISDNEGGEAKQM